MIKTLGIWVLALGMLVTNMTWIERGIERIYYKIDQVRLTHTIDTDKYFNRIFSVHAQGGSYGTGFVVELADGSKGLVTNYHVAKPGIRDGEILYAQDRHGDIEPAEVLLYSETYDLAILKCESIQGQPGLVLDADFKIRPGDKAFLLGNPGFDWELVIPAYFERQYPLWVLGDEQFQRSHSGLPLKGVMTLSFNLDAGGGSSGSPIFNDQGSVIAIHSMGYQGVSQSFDIPVRHVVELISALANGDIDKYNLDSAKHGSIINY